MKTIESFAKFLSNNAALMNKCVEADFDVEMLENLAAKNGFRLSSDELVPLAQAASAWMKKTRGERLSEDERKIVELVEMKAREMKLSDSDLSGVSGGQKEGYDKPSSIGKDGGEQAFPFVFVAAAAAAVFVATNLVRKG